MGWEEFVKEVQQGGAIDPNGLVQAVLRESYLQTTEDLRFYAEKVKYFNQTKKAIREHLQALRDFDRSAKSAATGRGIEWSRPDKKSTAAITKLIGEQSSAGTSGEMEKALGIPARVPGPKVKSFGQLEDEIKKWEEKLNSIGDDAQLANVDLQNVLQKQQQTLQMMSNISKMVHDTAMSIIRKIGG